MGSGPDLWFAVGFVPIVQTLPKWHICPNLGRICRCNGVFQCFQFIHALTFGLGQHIFRLGKAVLSQLGGAFAVFGFLPMASTPLQRYFKKFLYDLSRPLLYIPSGVGRCLG